MSEQPTCKMLKREHPIIKMYHCIMFSVKIYVFVPELVIKFVNILHDHIALLNITYQLMYFYI